MKVWSGSRPSTWQKCWVGPAGFWGRISTTSPAAKLWESRRESGQGCAGHRGCRGCPGGSVPLLPDPYPRPLATARLVSPAPHLSPEPVMSNSISRTSWKCEGPVTLWLVTMGARKGRCSEGGPGGSVPAPCCSPEHIVGASGRKCRVNLGGKLRRGRTVVRLLAGPGRPTAPVGLHSRDSGGDHTELRGHGVQRQHLLPQIVQPGVDGSVRPGEREHVRAGLGVPACGWACGNAPHPTHPSSCWSLPRHTGRRARPPSCSSRRCNFLATKLNLRRGSEARAHPAWAAGW